MAQRFSQTLPDRPVPHSLDGVVWALNRQIVLVLKELLRKLTQPPAAVPQSGSSAVTDVTVNNDFVAAVLTADTDISLSNGYDGAQGTIHVKQDAVGGHNLTFSSGDRTILRPSPDFDSSPNPAAGSITRYRYHLLTIDGIAYAVVERTRLS